MDISDNSMPEVMSIESKQVYALIIVLSMLLICHNLVLSNATAHELINYRGVAEISSKELKILWNININNLRFSLWTGYKWIELPFLIDNNAIENLYKHINLNSSSLLLKDDSLSTMTYQKTLVIFLPKTRGYLTKKNNWWHLAEKLNLNYRIPIVLRAKNNSTTIENIIYIYFGYGPSLIRPSYDLKSIYQYFDEEKILNSTALDTNIKQTRDGLDYKNKFKLNYRLFLTLEIEKQFTNQLTKTVTNPLFHVSDSLLIGEKFEHTGYNFKKSLKFRLPIRGKIYNDALFIHISGTAYNDPHTRKLEVYVNGKTLQHRISLEFVKYHFDFTIEISPEDMSLFYFWDSSTPNIPPPENIIYVRLTTYVGYWLIDMHISYAYEAQEHTSHYEGYLAMPYYKFSRTGWSVKKFALPLPTGLYDNRIGSSTTIKFHFNLQCHSDPYARFFKVYIDGKNVYSTIISGSRSISFNVSINEFTDKVYVMVGVVITTYVGYWIFKGTVYLSYRPEVFPDDSNQWIKNHISKSLRYGNIYVEDTLQIGNFAFDTFYYKEFRRFVTALRVSLWSDNALYMSKFSTIEITITKDTNGNPPNFPDFGCIRKEQHLLEYQSHPNKELIFVVKLMLIGISALKDFPTVVSGLIGIGFDELTSTGGPSYLLPIGNKIIAEYESPLFFEYHGNVVYFDEIYRLLIDDRCTDPSYSLVFNYDISFDIYYVIPQYAYIYMETISFNGMFHYGY